MINNLTQLKQQLRVGTTLRIIDSNNNHPKTNIDRKIAIKQSNAIKFEDNCWLYFGKSSDYSFNGDTFTYDETTRDNEIDKKYGAMLKYQIMDL